jgi:predicted nuclease of restriction endonuclease-like (RecB) superfamily
MKQLGKDTYKEFFNEIKEQVELARIKAARGLNEELIRLYYTIGESITNKQAKHEWGDRVVEQLSKDLTKHFGGTSGYSVQNLYYMRQFYLEYLNWKEILEYAVQIPWGQNILIMSKVKDMNAKTHYLKSTAQFGWSRNVLLNQIKAKAYERQLKEKKHHNFKTTLPVHLAEQANETIKSEYNLDFLGINQPVLERQLENRIVEKIKHVILELGYGFCFIGNQYKIRLSKKDYYVDLLFYHRKLKCLVAIDLKIGDFQPEYAGKMNFYLNLLDEKEKQPEENPSIGIILCADKDNIEVEFALKGIEKPIGVSDYKLTRRLPKNLQGELPSIKELEEKIKTELKRTSEN